MCRGCRHPIAQALLRQGNSNFLNFYLSISVSVILFGSCQKSKRNPSGTWWSLVAETCKDTETNFLDWLKVASGQKNVASYQAILPVAKFGNWQPKKETLSVFTRSEFPLYLPPTSAVEVIESVLSMCLCVPVCLSVSTLSLSQLNRLTYDLDFWHWG